MHARDFVTRHLAGIKVVALVLPLFLGLSATARASTPKTTQAVSLIVSPRRVQPGETIKEAVVNHTSREIFWGGCLLTQRLTNSAWQPAIWGQCLALIWFAAHTQRTIGTEPAPTEPGRYRISFLYQYQAKTVEANPPTAHAYLTVLPPPTPIGTLIGGIENVGGDPLASRSSEAGTVTVLDLQHQVRARERVRDGQRFRFTLSPGRYQLSVAGADKGPLACPTQIVTIRAHHATHANAIIGCGEY